MRDERNAAIILVTHQLQYVHAADKVLVLDDHGNQCFFGSSKEMLYNRSRFPFLDLGSSDDDSLLRSPTSLSPSSASKLQCSPEFVNNSFVLSDQDSIQLENSFELVPSDLVSIDFLKAEDENTAEILSSLPSQISSIALNPESGILFFKLFFF